MYLLSRGKGNGVKWFALLEVEFLTENLLIRVLYKVEILVWIVEGDEKFGNQLMIDWDQFIDEEIASDLISWSRRNRTW